MRKLFVITLLFLVAISLKGQVMWSFNNLNSNSIKVIIGYKAKSMGLFEKEMNKSLDELDVKTIKNYYAYDKKNKKLYVQTAEGNFVIELKDEYAKYYKKTVPNYKEEEINEKVVAVNKTLEDYYDAKNTATQEYLDKKKARERERQLQKEREDSIKKAMERQEKEEYGKTHKYSHIPVNNGSLYCKFCEKSITVSDTIIGLGASSDSIVWMDKLDGLLDLRYYHIHKAPIPYDLRTYSPFEYHYDVFKDSLNSKYDSIVVGELEYYNNTSFYDYMINLKKEAPNGFFMGWGWNDEFSITFHFKYMNTNKKTIKYIEVFFVVTNDVGDVRKTGSFRGTGPLEEWESASWNWDHSSYYVSGDATNMNISKVIITYMNGTKVTIPKNKLRFN